jgi:pyruvate dehydrogenase E2 component (dihydrolipoamide acetyltransferase)
VLRALPDVVMPRLSDSMTQGTILRWLKADGDAVQPGDELAEIEPDRSSVPLAAVPLESELAGLLRRVVPEGETVAVGAVVATVAEDNAPAPPAEAAAPPAGDGAEGSPPAEAPAATPPEPAVIERGTAKGDVTIEELSRPQQLVARRVAESKALVPEFSLSTEVDVEACLDLRAQLGGDDAPSVDDMVVKAAALALRDVPRGNAAYRDARFELYSRVNVGVAMPAQGALVVPTLFDADAKSLGEIARETRRLAERVRSGVITSPELRGGTFTVASLGAYGVVEFAPILIAPQAANLAVGAVRRLPRVVGDAVVPRHVLELTLVCDHRILYGAEAGELLARIRARLEEPVGLAL